MNGTMPKELFFFFVCKDSREFITYRQLHPRIHIKGNQSKDCPILAQRCLSYERDYNNPSSHPECSFLGGGKGQYLKGPLDTPTTPTQ